MKIIALNCNYNGLNPKQSGEVTVMADSSLARSGKPWFLPEFGDAMLCSPHIVYRMGRLGKNIARRFAHRYIDAVTIGCTVQACGLKGALGNAFDGAAMLGEMVTVQQAGDLDQLVARLACGEQMSECPARQMTMPIDEIIEWVSQYFTLKIGDLIFAGHPEQQLSLAIGDHLKGTINNLEVFDIKIK